MLGHMGLIHGPRHDRNNPAPFSAQNLPITGVSINCDSTTPPSCTDYTLIFMEIVEQVRQKIQGSKQFHYENFVRENIEFVQTELKKKPDNYRSFSEDIREIDEDVESAMLSFFDVPKDKVKPSPAYELNHIKVDGNLGIEGTIGEKIDLHTLVPDLVKPGTHYVDRRKTLTDREYVERGEAFLKHIQDQFESLEITKEDYAGVQTDLDQGQRDAEYANNHCKWGSSPNISVPKKVDLSTRMLAVKKLQEILALQWLELQRELYD